MIRKGQIRNQEANMIRFLSDMGFPVQLPVSPSLHLLTLLGLTLFSVVDGQYLFAQPPQVVSTTPNFNQIASSTLPAVSVTFNAPMDASTLTHLSFGVKGERSGYRAGQITYDSLALTASFLAGTAYSAGERITVMLSRSVRSQQGDSLTPFTWTFRIPSARRSEIRFADPVLYSGGGWSMQCADMNGDGYPDIVGSSGVIRLNDGTGLFPTTWSLPDADPAYKIGVDDFNRDGFMDVVYVGGSGLRIGTNNGQGGFAVQTLPYWLSDHVTGDFDSDGYPDIAGIVNDVEGRRWAVLFNDGTGSFSDTVVLGSVSQGWLPTIETFDVDNDGHLDIVCAGWEIAPWPDEYGLIVWKGNGRGGFSGPDLYLSTQFFWFPEQLYSADFSGNGFADISVFGYEGNVSLNLGGTFGTDTFSVRNYWGAERPGAMTGGDIDGDGWIDMIVSGFWFVPWEPGFRGYTVVRNCSTGFGNCLGGFTDTLGWGYLVRAVQGVDLDNDGDLDLVHSYGAFYVQENVSPPVSVIEQPSLPAGLMLAQNYPNPFNPSTHIRFEVGGLGFVSLRVYDVLGREVATLVNEIKPPGEYSVAWDATGFPSGVYFYRLTTKDGSTTRGMLLLR
jgi:hypothetical protein